MSKDCNCTDCTIVEDIFDDVFHRDSEMGQENDYLSLTGGDSEIAQINVKSYTLTNSNGMEVVLITWGATIVSLKCPDKYGRSGDIVLGFDNLKSYMNPELNHYFGCVLGRCANRIRNGSFRIGGKDYQLSLNENYKNHLHGGSNGFGRQIWDSCIEGCTVVMTYLSEDGQEGYPGAVLTTIRFRLTPKNELEIGMRATTSRATIVNLTHGSMFNLAGHDAGKEELMKHRISLNSDRWTFTDPNDPVPTGAIRGVGGTIMDLRIPIMLDDYIQRIPSGEGFDHNFCVSKGLQQSHRSFVARALHAESGRVLEIYSDQPGVQFYTGGHLPSLDCETISAVENDKRLRKFSDESFGECPEDFDTGENDNGNEKQYLAYIPGKEGAKYKKFGAFSVQPQNFPNAINLPNFPCSILRPGQVYSHNLLYKFGIQLGNYM